MVDAIPLAAVSVNRLNHLFADLRGAPMPTIEMYSRGLRKGGVLPETKRGSGGSGASTIHAAMMLCAIMRGSPVNATASAMEVGGLAPESGGGALMDPILNAVLEAVGWEETTTFAEAIGALIEHHARDTVDSIIADPASLWIEVDRYWTTAALTWKPSPSVAAEMVAAYTTVFGRDAATRMLDIGFDGAIHQPLRIPFHHPALLAAKIAYRDGDKEANRAAHAVFGASKALASECDVWGTEKVSHRTIAALGEAYRPRSATPVIAERQTTVTAPGASAPGQHEEDGQ